MKKVKENFVELIISSLFILYYVLHVNYGISLRLTSFLFEGRIAILPISFFIILALKYFKAKSVKIFFHDQLFTIVVFAAITISCRDIEFSFWLVLSHLIYTLFDILFVREQKKDIIILSTTLNLSPAKIIFITFFLFIMAGALLLMSPLAGKNGYLMSFPDALFMSSSAVSTTGLATISLVDDLSLFGQLVMLFLVQVGALGLMTFYSFFLVFIGRSMNLKDKLLLQDLLSAEHGDEIVKLLMDVVIYSFIIEFWGGIILTIAFLFEGMELGEASYHGFYHSVSAFCTAGFSTFSNSLENYKSNELINFTISTLCILGGLGFIVLQECVLFFKKIKKISQFTLHSKIVLCSFIIFFTVGTLTFFLNEFLYSLDQYSLWDKFQISFFQFMTAMTTAGFNSIAIDSLRPSTLFFLLPVMFIGGAPASTAGGVKVTTFAIVILTFKAFFFNEKRIQIFNKTISSYAMITAMAILTLSFFFVSIFLGMILFSESDQRFLILAFEVFSSFGTVGISAGITSSLTAAGKVILAILMFIARVGPLTLVLAMGEGRFNLHSDVQKAEVNLPF